MSLSFCGITLGNITVFSTENDVSDRDPCFVTKMMDVVLTLAACNLAPTTAPFIILDQMDKSV
jgi:hypothetical protein